MYVRNVINSRRMRCELCACCPPMVFTPTVVVVVCRYILIALCKFYAMWCLCSDCKYCKTYFRCILISRFWNVEISLHFNLAFSQCSISTLMGKLNFRVYLISWFYPTRESSENLVHAKNICFTVLTTDLLWLELLFLDVCHMAYNRKWMYLSKSTFRQEECINIVTSGERAAKLCIRFGLCWGNGCMFYYTAVQD